MDYSLCSILLPRVSEVSLYGCIRHPRVRMKHLHRTKNYEIHTECQEETDRNATQVTAHQLVKGMARYSVQFIIQPNINL